MNDISFSPVERFLFSDESLINFSVKDNVSVDISEDILLEVSRLRATDASITTASEKIFQHAGIGKGYSNQVNSVHRGDLRCWVTPDLCRDHKLNSIQSLVKRLVKSCASLKESHKLNGDYSVQLTVYVSMGFRFHISLLTHVHYSLETELITSSIWTHSPTRTRPSHPIALDV